MNLESLILGIICGLTIIILIVISFLTFNIFTTITNSSIYTSNSDVKKAHMYFLISFVILAISIIVFIMAVVIVGYGKIKHGKGGTKYNRKEIIKELKEFAEKVKSGKAKKSDIKEAEIDEEILRSTSSGERIFTLILFGIAFLSLVSLVLLSIGQSYLGKGKSASSKNGTADSNLTKASTSAWYAIGLSLLSLCIIIVIIGIKISSYLQDRKAIKETEQVIDSSPLAS